MATLIKYTGVEVRQEEQTVLHDVNFEIGEGEWVYLLGRVGSGKSSLLKTFYGELPIAAGQAQLLEYDLTKLKRKQVPYLRRKVGIVFQDFQLLFDRSVEDNLLFVLRATGWRNKQMMRDHVKDVLEQVGMATKAYKMPHQLSGGEQQRIVIARALLNSPAIVLADEPTGNLDNQTGTEIMELLKAIQQAGTTVIIATHNPMWVRDYQGRKFRFEDGRVTEE
ncbi:MAG: ATP-binding cassette domain-containing protein [Paludibacteraceae bacterium]|jgi:cell division transport system ATP-binding protein|nr:ATP-binding cassette domain-containing protein [Paludibacteraceae bacterium]